MLVTGSAPTRMAHIIVIRTPGWINLSMVDVMLALNLNNLEDHLETAKARASRGGTSQHRLRADVLAIMWLEHFPATGSKRRN